LTRSSCRACTAPSSARRSTTLRPFQYATDHDEITVGRGGDGTGLADLAERAGAHYPVHPDLDGAHQAASGAILPIMER
jgi:hypothetical protein